MDIYYVYAYVREDGTPYYIGKGKGRRAFGKHRNGRVPVPEDRSRIKFIFEELSEQDAFALEYLLIKYHGRKDHAGILLNLTDGGEGSSGAIRSEETRQKYSCAKKGKAISNETLQKRLGKKQSPEHIAKRANARKGQKHSPETILKISKAQKGKPGKPHSEETKQKISNTKMLKRKEKIIPLYVQS